jgi:CHAT domain-containing protein
LNVFQEHDFLIRWLGIQVNYAYAQANNKNPFQALESLEAASNRLWRQPRNAQEWQKLIQLIENKGFIAETVIGDYSEARSSYESAFDLFRAKLGEHNDAIARFLYHKCANVYTRLGEYDRAITLLQSGIDYAKHYNFPDAAQFGDIMIAYQCAGRFREALRAADESRQMPGLPIDNRFTIYLNQAAIQLQLHQHRNAQSALEKAFPLLDSLTYNKYYYRSDYFETQSNIFLAEHKYSEAIDAAKEALIANLAYSNNPKRREIAHLNNIMGEILLRAGQPDSALVYFQRALHCVGRNFTATAPGMNPDPALFYAENKIYEALDGKARAFLQLQHPEDALRCYELIPVVEAKLRETYQYQSSALNLLRESRGRLEQAVKTAYQCYQKTGDSVYAAKAFGFTEQAHGLLLSQSLTAARAAFQLPEEWRKREHDLYARDNWLEQQIFEEKLKDTPSGRIAGTALEQQRLELKTEIQRFQSERNVRFPDFTRLTQETKIVAAQEVSDLLLPGQAMTDFFVAGDTLFVFFFEKNQALSIRQTLLNEQLTLGKQEFLEYLDPLSKLEFNARRFCTLAAQFYDMLFRPELEHADPGLQSLICVPDNALSDLPFEVLLRAMPGTESPINLKTLPYLLRDFDLSSAGSATLLRLGQMPRLEAVAPELFAGFAPAYTNSTGPGIGNAALQASNETEYMELPGAQQEVLEAAKIMGGLHFLNKDARESAFKVNAPRFRILHLAMHAYSDEQHPALSCLVLGDKTVGEPDDNRLYFHELAGLHLRADLAVLSACKTGVGKYAQGEGVMSLARAFVLAGVPSTVMSLWKLPDDSTPEIMAGFYRYLKQGDRNAAALRHAKIDYLEETKNLKLLQPSYWAGLVLSGS